MEIAVFLQRATAALIHPTSDALTTDEIVLLGGRAGNEHNIGKLIVFVKIITSANPPIGVRGCKHKMTPLIFIPLNQLYAVNLQPALPLPVKHSCVMTAGAACSTRAACTGGNREIARARDGQRRREREREMFF